MRLRAELLPCCSSASLISGGVDLTGMLGPAHGRVPPDLEELTITEIQRRMGSGELTARQLTQAYIERIEAIDQDGPTLRSVLEVNPDALRIAEQLDQERASGRVRGPLHGVPILVK